jgi:hypothetical protein
VTPGWCPSGDGGEGFMRGAGTAEEAWEGAHSQTSIVLMMTGTGRIGRFWIGCDGMGQGRMSLIPADLKAAATVNQRLSLESSTGMYTMVLFCLFRIGWNSG